MVKVCSLGKLNTPKVVGALIVGGEVFQPASPSDLQLANLVWPVLVSLPPLTNLNQPGDHQDHTHLIKSHYITLI